MAILKIRDEFGNFIEIPALKGDKGNDGLDFTIKGLYPTLLALQTAQPTGVVGDYWAVGNANYSDLYIWDSITNSWVDIGQVGINLNANFVFITDSGSHFTSNEVEGALQEIGAILYPFANGGLKNWIINGMFDVWQRGTSQTTGGYGSDDRWANEHSGSTKAQSQQAFTVGQTVVPNNPKYFSRTVVTSVAGINNFVSKIQKIEDVTKLAGKIVTLSFWAKADTNKNISIEFIQDFGTGGSTRVEALGVQKFALTTSWQRFTKTFTFPTITGKTIGADNNIRLTIWFDAGANFDARTNSLGQQSGTFDIANVSLVDGSVAVECQNQPYADVLRDCQRYFCKSFSTEIAPVQGYEDKRGGIVSFFTTTIAQSTKFSFPVPMRKTLPTISIYRTTATVTNGAAAIYVNNWITATATTPQFITENGFFFEISVGVAQSVGSSAILSVNWTADAEL